MAEVQVYFKIWTQWKINDFYSKKNLPSPLLSSKMVSALCLIKYIEHYAQRSHSLSKSNINFLFNQHWKTSNIIISTLREADVLDMSLCAEQTTSYFHGVHGPLVAWSVFLIATLILLNTPFVAFYTNTYKSISQFTLVTLLMLAEEFRK